MARRSGVVVTLGSNVSATTTAVHWPGGDGFMTIEGTWSGATATLQVQSQHGTWIAVGPDTTFTADGAAGFSLGECQIRVLIAGGPPSAVYAYAQQM